MKENLPRYASDQSEEAEEDEESEKVGSLSGTSGRPTSMARMGGRRQRRLEQGFFVTV